MTNGGLELERDYHPPGEYRFTPDALTLSFCLQKIEVEQVDDTRPWSGTCFRDDIKVMPRGRPRTFKHRTGCRFACITIPDDGVDIDSERLVQLRPQIALRDVRLRLVLEALLLDATSGAQSRLFRDAVARAVVARLIELDGVRRAPVRTPALAPAVLARVLEYLDGQLGDVSVADLAAVAGLSSAHFATAFRASVGEPPHRYHLRLRIERARLLLEQGMGPAEAALATGFCDQSHLARHMQRRLGVTPGALARAYRATRKRPSR